MAQGQDVQAGDLLVELDATEPQLSMAEERQRLQALQAQRTARQQEHTTVEALWQATEQGAKIALNEARNRYQEAMAAVQTAQDKAQRFGPLALLAEQPQLKTVVEAALTALQRLEHEQRVRALEWQVRQAQYQREIVVLDGELALATARLQRWEHALALRRLHAPIAGRLRVLTHLVPGVVVREGERLGVIISPGAILVTASVAPPLAKGRLHPGQAAWLHFAAGPTTVAEALPATVTQVTDAVSEAGQGIVLRLAPEALMHMPLQSAVLRSLTIEVDRVAPLTHLWRFLQQCLGLRAPDVTACTICAPVVSRVMMTHVWQDGFGTHARHNMVMFPLGG
jgi:multidrug resistance efflux pump